MGKFEKIEKIAAEADSGKTGCRAQELGAEVRNSS
jgi:hypothetical protein